VRTLEVKKDINPPLDSLPSPSPSLMDFSPVRDFILDLDVASIELPDDVYAAVILAGLLPEDFHPELLDADDEDAASPSPLPVPDPSTRPLAPIPVLWAPQPTRPSAYGKWSPEPDDDDYASPIAPPNSEEEPPSLALDAFHRVDEWRTQSAPLLEAAGQEVSSLSSPSSRSEPFDAFKRPFTRVNTPASDGDGHQSDQSVSASATREESQLPRQDSYPSYPPPANPHASVALDAVHPRPAREYVAEPPQYPIYTGEEPHAATAKGKTPADGGARGLRREHAGVWHGVCATKYAPPAHGAWYFPQQFSTPLAATWIPTYPPPPPVYPFCHRCNTSRPDHPADLCPVDVRCLYCAGGHLSCHCPWPHFLCTATDCFCPSDHNFAEPEGVRNPVWECPTSLIQRRRSY
jgi:hypothetical protein